MSVSHPQITVEHESTSNCRRDASSFVKHLLKVHFIVTNVAYPVALTFDFMQITFPVLMELYSV